MYLLLSRNVATCIRGNFLLHTLAYIDERECDPFPTLRKSQDLNKLLMLRFW